MLETCEASDFLSLLANRPAGITLFEPYIAREMVTRLLWRGGSSLWDTAAHRLDTLTEVYSYIRSGTVIVDAAGEDDGALTDALEGRAEGCIYTVIADSDESFRRYAACDKVCALATRRRIGKIIEKPMIYLADARENPLDAAASAKERGMSGIHLTGDSPLEELLETADDGIALLGGLGTDYLNESGPLTIYARVESLVKQSGGRWAIGSGNSGRPIEYLSFISMLGIYNKVKNEEY